MGRFIHNNLGSVTKIGFWPKHQQMVGKQKVLGMGSSWFGVTYKEDKPYVIEQVQDLIDEGAYPDRLF